MIYTTGKVAKLFCVSRSHIRNCCNKGLLESTVLPGGRNRMITSEAVEKFALRFGIDPESIGLTKTDKLAVGPIRVEVEFIPDKQGGKLSYAGKLWKPVE